MDYNSVITFIQEHFTDGLALVIGSGLSAAEGIPGMLALASHLSTRAEELTGSDANLWQSIQSSLDAGEGLEASLIKHTPSESLETWISKETCALLLPAERDVLGKVLLGSRSLRLTTFLSKVLKPSNGLPILTPNYDRLIEVACEMAGFHVDTTAIGQYAGEFNHVRSCMGSCRSISRRGKIPVLDHFPRAIVLKPHGSFDWYRYGNEARRCSLDLDAPRLIITPGINKYQAGYNVPFDKHRDLANDYINKAARLLVVGYGFNDDHLQTHLNRRIQAGVPTLILTLSLSPHVKTLVESSPNCICISKKTSGTGVAVMGQAHSFEEEGPALWDLGTLANELLS